MIDTEIVVECPECGEQCAVVYGCGWENDFIFCTCGFELFLNESTTFDYGE